MLKKLLFSLFFVATITAAYSVSFAQNKQPITDLEPFNKNDCILICAPHPDDETICCGGVIQQALAAGAKVKIVYLTNGDANELAFIVYEKRLTFEKGEFLHMGKVRMQEAIAATKILGLKESDLIFLGYPDLSTFKIFSQYWQENKPREGVFTKAKSVPYKDDFSFGESYVGESILTDLEKVILDYKPNKIFISHPSDVNGDHKTFYLFLQIALLDLKKDIESPKVYPYLTHCVGWPIPRHYHPELNLEPPKKFSGTDINWQKLELSSKEVDKKYHALLCHKSETESSDFYLSAFVRKNELFSDYPEIELERQISDKERGVSFFGSSKMFESSENEELENLNTYTENHGEVSYAVADNVLFIRIQKPKKLSSMFGVQIYLFGYSRITPFAQMPKIRIITTHKEIKVFDKRTKINPSGVSLDFGSNVWILRIPLQVLGNPQFILTSMKAHGGELPEESIGFRKIIIK
jgi:LmbE family N-acetylglucosaminyl deacetylase